MMNPEDDLSMEILRRAEKMANEAYPEAVRDHNKESVKLSWADCILQLTYVERKQRFKTQHATMLSMG